MNRTMIGALAAAWLAAGPALALNLCVEGAYPPFSETSADGSIVGFDIDIGQALCAEMGETCELVKVDWDGIIPALLEKKCDAIVASMSATEERKQVIDFTDKYYHIPNRFVAARRRRARRHARGAGGQGRRRAARHHPPGLTWRAQYPDTELRLYGTQDEVMLDLQRRAARRGDGRRRSLDEGFLKTPAGEGFAFFGAENHFDPAIHGEGAAIGVRKEDTELRDSFSAAIAAIRANGNYDEIAEQVLRLRRLRRLT